MHECAREYTHIISRIIVSCGAGRHERDDKEHEGAPAKTAREIGFRLSGWFVPFALQRNVYGIYSRVSRLRRSPGDGAGRDNEVIPSW